MWSRQDNVDLHCVSPDYLVDLCWEQWDILKEDTVLMGLIEKHGVKRLVVQGLAAGVSERQKDWEAEMGLFHLGGSDGDIGEEGARWGEQEVSIGPGGTNYHEEKMRRAMGVFIGEGVGAGNEVIVVASDGSGGDGVGFGVLVGRADSAQELSEIGGRSRVGIVREEKRRVPAKVGSLVADNQFAEDVGGVKGLMACIRDGGVLLVIDNKQTVQDIVEAGGESGVTAREAMRHRCGPVWWMTR